ncbi:MAG: DUF1836 domain-containing protein [Clostridia bacterium]|nr:DUF1836 domain-containing protein [Clostridia bacterium]
MEQIKDLIDRMIAQTDLTYDRLPDIDLYMDQVIEYLSRRCVSSRENDKISSAMINNYIKDGLLPRANDKKYGREHLAYLMMIARLKQMLSVKDTGLLLKADTEGKDIVSYFDGFQALVADTARAVGESLPEDDDGLSAVALRLAVSGYVSRIVCELILARLEERTAAEAPETEEPAPAKAEKSKEKKDSAKAEKKKEKARSAEEPK